MHHTKFRHITGHMDDMESGESDLESFVATVNISLSVTAYSGEPRASLVTKVKKESDIDPICFFLQQFLNNLM